MNVGIQPGQPNAVDADLLCREVLTRLPDPVLVIECAPQGGLCLVTANPAARRWLALPAELPMQAPLDGLLTRPLLTEFEAQAARCLDSGSSVTYRSEALREALWQIRFDPLPKSGAHPRRAMVVARDVGDQERAMARLTLLEAALDQAREQVTIIDRNSRLRYANAETSRALGYSREELLRMNVGDFDPEWPRERWPEAWEELRARGAMTMRSTHRRKDGSTFPVEVMTSHLQFGAEEYVVALVLDITERARMEAELHSRAEEFRALVENSPDVVLRYDRDCRLIYMNHAMDQLGGPLSRNRMGTRPTEYSPLLSVPSAYESAIRRALDSGETQELVFNGHDVRGEFFWAQARFVPERNPAGQIVSVLAIGHDVTALKDAELRWRTLVDSIPAMLARFDREGRVVYANHNILETFHHSSLDEIIGKPPPGTDENGRPLAEVIREVAATGEGNSCKVTWETPGGSRHYTVRHIPERDEDGAIKSVLGIATDVTPLVETERTLQRLNRSLKTLSSGNEALVRATDEAELLVEMCRVLVDVGGHPLAWIGYPAADGSVAPLASAGPGKGFLATRQQFGQGDPASLTARTAEIQILRTAKDHQKLAPSVVQEAHRFGLRASITLPLPIAPDQCGVLAIYAADPAAFDEDEVLLLGEMASDLAYGIRALRARVEREQFLERLNSSMHSTIHALSNTVELRDPYTAGHQRRVANLAADIARSLGWPEERIHALYLTGLVHDIGKIAVPTEILSKPGRLNPSELSLVRTHAQSGYEILRAVDFPWPIADYVHQHHERLDGSGYPLGLKGDEILPEARVLSVADVVEAMSIHRPYRPGLGLAAALEEISRNRGVQFDADAVDACVKLVRAPGFRFE